MPKRQLPFTHISRTGGTTLTNCLHDAIPFPNVQQLLEQHSPLATNTEYRDPTAKYWKDFDAFLEDWASQKIIIDGVVRRKLSQWVQLADANGQLLTDDIGRFETLATDIPVY